MLFGQSGKLTLGYINHYSITKRVREVSYWLKLPNELLRLHNVFHVSQLHKYIPNPTHVIKLKPLQLWEDLAYEEQLIEILDNREKQLYKKVVSTCEGPSG